MQSDPTMARFDAGPVRLPAEGPGCRQLISIDLARAIALADARGLREEEVPTGTSGGRILAEDIVATSALPEVDCAAMDGIAVRMSDLEETPPGVRSDESGPPLPRVRPGFADSICTGMPIPTGFEAVVPVERVRPSQGWLEIEGAVRPGDHIRRAGEQIRAGELAVPAGVRVNPPTIGLLSALGRTTVRVWAAPRITILVTGEELCSAGGPRHDGAVLDSNGPMLEALVVAAGGILVDRLLVTDDPTAIHHALVRLAADSDLVVTSGGASVGTRDHLVATVRASGELLIHQLDVKPGRPTSLGRIDGTPIVLLPGNPLAALIGFEALGRPILRSLAGDPNPLRSRIAARAEAPVDHRQGRMECVPVQVAWLGGLAMATPLHHRGSGMLRGASRADGIAILEADRGAVVDGDELVVELWA